MDKPKCHLGSLALSCLTALGDERYHMICGFTVSYMWHSTWP